MESRDSDPLFLTPLRAEAEGHDQFGPGSRLGKYELIKRLSVGGMAEIFLARAVGLPGFQKLVAIKRILPQLAKKADFLEMFLDEARIAATLQHTHIIQTYDVCVLSGNYIIAMEYLHGEDVRSILSAAVHANKRIPLENVLEIMIALLSGLNYAHDKEGFDGKPLEIVHCDVTPGNVIVTYNGDVKLLDFGIANAASKAREAISGSVKGKLSYMSPEQARGEQVDRRTDVFAAGVILYELTMGRKLYRGTEYEIINKIVKGQIEAPHTIDKDYDPKLEQIVLRALERDPTRRYQTAWEMQQDLEALARERGLFLSITGLKKFMSELFGNKLDAWREAQKQGKSLVEHLELVASYEDDAEELPEPPPPPRKKWVVGAVAGGLAVAVAGGVVALRPHQGAVGQLVPPVVAAMPGKTPAPLEVPSLPSAGPAAAPAPARAGSGSVKIITHPHGATLLLDGKPAGARSPYTFEKLPAGDHTVVAQLAGHLDSSKRFTLVANDRPTLTLNLQKPQAHTVAAPAPAPSASAAPAPTPAAPAPAKLEGNGTLAIASNPWCTVSVDGVDKGQTPVNLTLPAGKHQVTLTNPDYKIKRQLSVNIAPGEAVRKKLDFTE